MIFAGSAKSQNVIRYTLRFPDAASHHVDVEATYPAGKNATIEVKMAVWTAYVIREYAQHVEVLHSRYGAQKTRKNRWRINTGGQPEVTIRYRLYAESMQVQDNYVSENFALLNGQPTFLTLADGSWRHQVHIELPPSWKTVVTPLPGNASTGFVARDYEHLADSPIIAGNPAISEFRVDNKTHYLVNVGQSADWQNSSIVRDLARIVEVQRNIWGSLPYDQYFFFNVLSGKGGGMEHANSTVMMTSPETPKTRPAYLAWLDLASHELFHVWNVKRLRPREFQPGEYESEQYTDALGIAEGFTSYYALVSLRRAGLLTETEYLDRLGRLIDSLQHTEGRKIQSLAEASFDTWIKFYRPNKNSDRSTVSYYTKGAVVALLLDARIRAATEGKRSLDDVMRMSLERYPPESGYTLEEFREVASRVAGVPLNSEFERWFKTTEELDYREAEAVFRWRIAPDKNGVWNVTRR